MGGPTITFIRQRGVYTGAGAVSVVVPDGVYSLAAWLQGAGGSGRERVGVDGSGGGGGGFCYFATDILESEWGSSITLDVGVGGVGDDGGDTTMSGTLNGAVFSINAGGGRRGTTGADGAGGTASGGTTNVPGQSGYGYVAAPIDERAPGFGGAAGGDGQDLVEAGYGAGSSGSQPFPSGVLEPGQDGYIAIEWG